MHLPQKKGHYIFRASITRNGIKLYARNFGLRAFPIWVED